MHEHHDHGHGHSHSRPEAGQTLAVLTYMLEHNRHHAEELSQHAEKLLAQGQSHAAGLLKEGVRDFTAGNEKIAKAIEEIKEA